MVVQGKVKAKGGAIFGAAQEKKRKRKTKPGTNRGLSCGGGHALLGSLQMRQTRPRARRPALSRKARDPSHTISWCELQHAKQWREQ